MSRDGKFVAVGGDGRAIYDGGDGHAIWPSDPPPPTVAVDICLLDRLQFSPQASWIASSSYSGELEVFRFGDRPSAQAWPSARVLPGECDAATFSRDGRLVATSTPALYETSATQGDWKIAADKLMHLATGEVRSLSPDADPESPALFTPEGDIIAGSRNGTLTRYCRRD